MTWKDAKEVAQWSVAIFTLVVGFLLYFLLCAVLTAVPFVIVAFVVKWLFF